jgi:hypothetical protein
MPTKKKKRIRRPKHTRDFIAAEFKKFGYTLLTKTYVGTKQPLEVKCKKGHKSVVCWNNFAKGHRCRQCLIESRTGNNKQLKRIMLRDKYYQLSEAARILGVRYDDLRRHVELGLLPGPKRSFGAAKKYYKMEDIEAIEKLIE